MLDGEEDTIKMECRLWNIFFLSSSAKEDIFFIFKEFFFKKRNIFQKFNQLNIETFENLPTEYTAKEGGYPKLISLLSNWLIISNRVMGPKRIISLVILVITYGIKIGLSLDMMMDQTSIRALRSTWHWWEGKTSEIRIRITP